MPNFRRYYELNSIVFVTGVARDRKPYLKESDDLDVFWATMRCVQSLHSFNLLAYVILWDHFHWLMRVGGETGDFSAVLHSVKRNCTLNYKKAHGIVSSFSLWQPRFWDHIIRNEQDLEKHFDYIHWNPVKHRYVQRPEDWGQSTYAHWLERKYYEIGWGYAEEPPSVVDMDFE